MEGSNIVRTAVQSFACIVAVNSRHHFVTKHGASSSYILAPAASWLQVQDRIWALKLNVV